MFTAYFATIEEIVIKINRNFLKILLKISNVLFKKFEYLYMKVYLILNKATCVGYLKNHPMPLLQAKSIPVDWGCRVCQLHPCRGVKPLPTSVLDMTRDYLMVRFQFWSFGEYGILLHCYSSQVHFDLEW